MMNVLNKLLFDLKIFKKINKRNIFYIKKKQKYLLFIFNCV